VGLRHRPNWFSTGFSTASVDSYFSDPLSSLFIAFELSFVRPKFGCVVDESAVSRAGWMLDMEQFVVEDVVQDEVRDHRGIKQQAYEDGVVCGVVPAQNPPRARRGPGQPRALELPSEVLRIDAIEIQLQVLPPPFRDRRTRATSAYSARGPGALLHFGIENEGAIQRMVAIIDGSPVNLGKQDQGEGMQHFLRRVCQQIADANKQPILTEARGMRQARKRKEFDMHLGQRRPWLE